MSPKDSKSKRSNSAERKKLPKASENPALTMEKFVTMSIVTGTQPEDLVDLQASISHDEDQFARDSDNDVEVMFGEQDEQPKMASPEKPVPLPAICTSPRILAESKPEP
jgi:hypothetical protein